jgi:hypothetical protein
MTPRYSFAGAAPSVFGMTAAPFVADIKADVSALIGSSPALKADCARISSIGGFSAGTRKSSPASTLPKPTLAPFAPLPPKGATGVQDADVLQIADRLDHLAKRGRHRLDPLLGELEIDHIAAEPVLRLVPQHDDCSLRLAGLSHAGRLDLVGFGLCGGRRLGRLAAIDRGALFSFGQPMFLAAAISSSISIMR